MQAALQSGVDVNSRDPDGEMTALMYAVRRRSKSSVVSLLLEQEDIDVNIETREGETALHFAARDDRNSECLAMLLARPDLTIVNQRDKFGCTPLFVAVSARPRIWPKAKGAKGGRRLGAVRCVQLLLSDERTDPNIKSYEQYTEKDGSLCWVCEGDSPLMYAVKWNYVDCVKLLLADPRVDLSEREER